MELLPYVGQQPIYDAIDFHDVDLGALDEPPTSARNGKMLAHPVPLFRCISDDGGPGSTNYRACMGNLPYGERESKARERQAGAYFSRGIPRRNGHFPARISRIRDGLSQTALLSERITGDLDVERYEPVRDTLLVADLQDTNRALFEQVIRDSEALQRLCAGLLIPEAPLHMSFGGASWLFPRHSYTHYNHVLAPNSRVVDCTPEGTKHFSLGTATARSWHTGGVNVAMADGAVHFINEKVDLDLWRAVGTRAGRESIETHW